MSQLIPQLTPTVRPEIALLLACARTNLDAETSRRVEELVRGNIDWDYLVDLAEENRVLPLLYWSLNTAAPGAVAADTLEALRARYREGAKQSLFLAGELLKLLAVFKAEGIQAIPLKGPLLAEIAYGNLSLRQCSDLDILVHKRDVLRVKKLLASLGYAPEWPEDDRYEAEYFRSGYAYPFVHEVNGLLVEIHYRIRPTFFSFALDPKDMWSRAATVALAGTEVSCLSIEDLLLTLCVHGSYHHWQCLSWICDIAELLRRYERVDWESLLSQARAVGSERMLLLGLCLAHELLGAPVPDEILRLLHADVAVERLALRVCDVLFQRAGSQLRFFERPRFHLAARERLRDRLGYVFYTIAIPTEAEWGLISLPSVLYFLYSPIRLVHLVVLYAIGFSKTAASLFARRLRRHSLKA